MNEAISKFNVIYSEEVKSQKTPQKEISRAEEIRKDYFENKK